LRRGRARGIPLVLGEIGDFRGRCLGERFLGQDGFQGVRCFNFVGEECEGMLWGRQTERGQESVSAAKTEPFSPPPAAPGKRKRKAAAAAGRATLWGECGEGTKDRLGWLRCGECNTAAHRFCLGLGPSSQLGNRYLCCQCEAWRAWEGGEAAGRAAERASRAITVLEGEALETSSADTYRHRLEALRKWAVGAGFTEEDAFPSGPREAMAEVVALGVFAHGSRTWSPAWWRWSTGWS